jgi:hypothetical protein
VRVRLGGGGAALALGLLLQEFETHARMHVRLCAFLQHDTQHATAAANSGKSFTTLSTSVGTHTRMHGLDHAHTCVYIERICVCTLSARTHTYMCVFVCVCLCV